MDTEMKPDVAVAPVPPVEARRAQRFRLLYDANYDDLWRYCLRRAANADEAEDVLSATFAVAWRKFEKMPTDPADARPWLFGVARNELRSTTRRNRRTRALVDRMASQPASSPTDDPAALALDASDAVLNALTALRPRDQEVLRLAAWEQLPHREIAMILGCSENAVSIRLHRARDRLARQLIQAEQLPATKRKGNRHG